MSKHKNIHLALGLIIFLTLQGCGLFAPLSPPLIKQGVPDDDVDSSCSYFYFLWGSNAEYAERYEEALEAFEKASICDPKADYIAEKIPVLLIQLDRFSEAADWLEKYIENKPEKVLQRYMLARLKIREGKEDDAIKLYHEALDLDPENDTTRLRLGMLYARKGEFRTAESFFKTILEKGEHTYYALVYLARLYIRTNEISIAEFRYLEALDFSWSSELAFEIAEFYNSQKEYEKAKGMFERILKKEEKDERASLGLAQTYLYLGNGKAALKELTRIKQFSGNPERIDLIRSQILVNLGENSEAKKILKKILKKESIPQANYLLGIILFEELNFEESMEVLEQIPPDAEEFQEAILLRIRMHEESSQTEQSISILRQALSLEESRLTLFYSLLASIYQKYNRIEESLATLAEGLRYYPDDETILYDYAILLEKSGKHEEAMAWMLKLNALNPDNADSLNFIGYSWADENINLEKAHEYIKRALKLKPESGYILDSLGWVLFRMGKYKEAKEILEKAISLEPDDPFIYEHLGDTLRALGEINLSEENYRKALEILDDPKEREEIEKKINELNTE